MRILVTGASGFLGKHICAYLESLGHTVTRSVRVAPHDIGTKEWLITGDLQTHTDLTPVLRDFDVVVHSAGLAHIFHSKAANTEDIYFQANVVATERLAQAAAQAKVRRFVFISSIGVYGHMVRTPITEAQSFAPSEPYTRSKLLAERCLQKVGAYGNLETVIVRPTLIYGPHCPGNMARLVSLVRRGWPLPLAAYTQPRSLLAVEHLCSLMGLLVEHPAAAHQTFVAADPQMVSLVEILNAIAQGLDMPLRLWRLPDAILHAGATLAGLGPTLNKLLRPLQVDATFAQVQLNWHPKNSTIEGIRKTAASFLEQPPLTVRAQ